MEAFTLLKSWKPSERERETPQPLPTIPSPIDAAAAEDTETTDEDDDDDDEPFFDLEFTIPEEEEEEEDDDINESDNSEFRFTISPSTNDPNLVQLELLSSEPNSKPQLKASLLKSATKLRVLISGLNKSKFSNSTAQIPNQKQESEPQKKKLFAVKFNLDEVPFASLFTRDNNSKGKTANNKASQKKKNMNQNNTEESKLHSPSSDEKLRFSVEKYLKKVKPLYIKVSRKYAEKLKFSGQINTPPVKNAVAEKVLTGVDTTENELKSQKQGTLPLPAGLRVVCKRLKKSRSAAASPEAGTVLSRRRDDSMMDGIQSAILHCKTSFNASKEESPQLESSRKVLNNLEDEGGSLK